MERDGLSAKIPPEAWHALLVNGSPRQYGIGEVLVRQGEPDRYVLALTSGLVKVVRIEADGQELVMAVRGRGEIIGVITHLDGQERSATVTAISACLAYMVSEVRFRRIVGEFNIGDVILRHVTARLRESEDIRSELAYGRLDATAGPDFLRGSLTLAAQRRADLPQTPDDRESR